MLLQARAQEAIAAAEKSVENADRALRWAQSPANQSYVDEAQTQVTLAKDRLDKAKEKYAPYENKPEDNLVLDWLGQDTSAPRGIMALWPFSERETSEMRFIRPCTAC